MVRFTHPQNKHGPGRNLGPDGIPENSRFNDMASYVTDTSSITNPAEFGMSYSNVTEEGEEEEQSNMGDVSFVSNATSALTGLTGWTSANGGGAMTEVSELGESGHFPIAHSKSQRSTFTAISEGDETGAVSEMLSEHISAVSFDMDGSVETSMGEIEVPRSTSYARSKGSGGVSRNNKDHHPQSNHNSNKNNRGRPPLSVIPPGKAVQFRTPSHASSSSHQSQKSKSSKSKGSAYGASANAAPPAPSSPSSSSILSSNSKGSNSSRSKKRAPVPPLRDPNMDDTEQDQMWEEECNYDINPTPMFLVLEEHAWEQAMQLLDGKGGVGEKNKEEEGAWGLGTLFGGIKKKEESSGGVGGANAATIEEVKKRQKALKQQARTWIVRRERNGVLRWRMLPLHAAMAFNAPFEIVLRLYHLYPGAVRCRNDLGMLPLHHVFKYGNEDKILELLMDVYPEAFTVKDDKGRLPLECTPKDGSDNERRTHILKLFGNFQVDLAKKEMKKEEHGTAALSVETSNDTNPAKAVAAPPTPDSKTKAGSIQPVLPLTRVSTPMTPNGSSMEGTLGAVPRYTSNNVHMGYNAVTYNSIKPLGATNIDTKKEVQQAPSTPTKAAAPPTTPLSPKEVDTSDKYAMLNSEDSENNSSLANSGKVGGLSPIREQEEDDDDGEPSLARKALKSELLALGETKKKKKGFRKLFGKKKALAQI